MRKRKWGWVWDHPGHGNLSGHDIVESTLEQSHHERSPIVVTSRVIDRLERLGWKMYAGEVIKHGIPGLTFVPREEVVP